MVCLMQSITFPHLGMEFEQVSRGFSIFGFVISRYSILLVVGIIVAVGLTAIEAERTMQYAEEYLELSIWVGAFSIIGARALYVVLEWPYFAQHPLQILNLRKGGLALYGAIFAGILVAWIYSVFRQMSLGLILDTSLIGMVFLQIIGRFGDFFNREGFGEYTDGLFAMQIPVDMVRVSDVTERMKNHMEVIGGVRMIQVHPAFAYEIVWCFVLLLILSIYRSSKRFDGEIFLLYLMGYSIGRIGIESLRTDRMLIWGTKIPAMIVIGGISIVICLIILIYNWIHENTSDRRRIRSREARRHQKSKRNLFELN